MYVDINCDKLAENSSDIKNSYLLDYDFYVKRIEETVENMGTAWKGKDYDNFYNKMTEVIVSLNALRKYVNSCNDFIEKYVNIVEKLDVKYQNRKINID